MATATDTEIEDDEDIDILPEGEEGSTPTPPPDPNADLRAAVTELTRITTEGAKPRPEEDKPLSDDEKAELWAIYDPRKSKKDFMKKYFRLNPDATDEEEAEVAELFSDMQKGIVRQAIKGSMNIHEVEMRKLREEIEPLKRYYADAQARELRSRFSEAYDDFADPKFNKLLELADKAQAGKRFNSEAEYFKAVAETAAEALKTGQPDFVLGAAKKQTKTTGLTARTPRLIAGGGAGAGTGGGAKAAKDDLDGIFDI
jgi:hypothetical protein